MNNPIYNIELWRLPSRSGDGFSLPENRPAELEMVPLEIWHRFASEMNSNQQTATKLSIIVLIGLLLTFGLLVYTKSSPSPGMWIITFLAAIFSLVAACYKYNAVFSHNQDSVNRINTEVKAVRFSYTVGYTRRRNRRLVDLIAKGQPAVISTAWQTFVDPHTHKTMYCNTITRETSLDPPQAYINASWQSYVEPETQKMVYFNTVTRQTSVTPPSNCTVVPAPGTQPAEPIIQTVVSPIPMAFATPVNAHDTNAAPAMLGSGQPPPPAYPGNGALPPPPADPGNGVLPPPHAYSANDQKRGDNDINAFGLDI